VVIGRSGDVVASGSQASDQLGTAARTIAFDYSFALYLTHCSILRGTLYAAGALFLIFATMAVIAIVIAIAISTEMRHRAFAVLLANERLENAASGPCRLSRSP
jgi:pilus assembly protein TadC